MNFLNNSESPLNFGEIWKRVAKFQPNDKIDVAASLTPLLIFFSGLATFIAVVLGYLYLERRAVQDAVEEADHRGRPAREEGDGEEVEEEDHKEGLEDEGKGVDDGIGPWPTDGPAGENDDEGRFRFCIFQFILNLI